MNLVPAPAARLLPRLLSDTRYALTGLPLAVASVIVAVTPFAAGLGLAVVWIGVPLLIFAMAVARRFADLERARIATVLGTAVRRPAYPTTIKARLTHPQSWRDVAHALLRWIPSTIAFVLTATWWSAMLGSLTWGAWGWSLPDGPGNHELPELLGITDSYGGIVLFYLALSVVFAITLPAVVRGAAVLEARFGRALLIRA
ncbi:sensor domain-containing protein [Actinoplanes octamycinicus]|nr:hypothetical protein Aoc01nite_15430 [Actinoplanes octamycinicus]